MAITRHGLDTDKLHFEPPLCIPSDIRVIFWADVVRTTHMIEYVTCEMCRYYYYHIWERGRA